MKPCTHPECQDRVTCQLDGGSPGGLRLGGLERTAEADALRERIKELRKAHAATRKSLKELEDRFFQTLLHGTPPGHRPSTQSQIDAARMAAAKEIIGALGKETDLRLVAENWCASAMQELANAAYLREGRDEVLRALRRVLTSDSDNKFEMKEARAAAQDIIIKYHNIQPEEHWVAIHETTAWGQGKTGLEAYTDAVRRLTESGIEIPTLKVQRTVDAEWSEIR